MGDGGKARRKALPLRLKSLSDQPSPLGGVGLEMLIVVTTLGVVKEIVELRKSFSVDIDVPRPINTHEKRVARRRGN